MFRASNFVFLAQRILSIRLRFMQKEVQGMDGGLN